MSLLALVLLPLFFQQEAWLPLEKGRTWVYSTSAEIEMVVRVVGEEKLGDVSCAVVETTFDGRSSREWLGRDEDGVKLFRVRAGVMDVALEEPVLRIRALLKGGDTWLSVMNDGGTARAIHFSVEGPLEVKVGEKRYSCMKVTATSRSGKTKVVSESWYAKGVGMVRQRHSTGGATLIAELKRVETPSGGDGK